MKKLLTVVIIIAVAMPLVFMAKHAESFPNQEKDPLADYIHVGGTGPNNYTRIQEAVDNASNKDTIYIHPGEYFENVVVNKSVTLLGANRTSTVLKGDPGSGLDWILFVNTSEATITNMTLPGSGSSLGVFIKGGSKNTLSCLDFGGHGKGILLNLSFENTIEDCNFYNNTIAISSEEYSSKNFYKNNIFLNNSCGILLAASSTERVIGNHFTNGTYAIEDHEGLKTSISNNSMEGMVYGMVAILSSNITISGNTISNVEKGIWAQNISRPSITANNIADCELGMVVENSTQSTLSQNIIEGCGTGAMLTSSSGITVNDNLFSGCGTGLSLVNDAKGARIYSNIFQHCTDFGLRLSSSGNNSVYSNNFYSNAVHAFSDMNNTFHHAPPTGGNHYGNWTAPDVNGDMIVDLPFTIPGGNCSDAYPLVHPYPRTIPTAPRNFTAVAVHAAIDMRWDEPLGNADKVLQYAIFRNGSNLPLAVLPANVRNYTDVTMLPYVRYTYFVVARTSDAEGFPSLSASLSTFLDRDGDGVPDHLDAFPDDPAASVDSDGDGYPEHWNPGHNETTSTTGLILDAFPFDPAASLDTDGDGYPDEWNEGHTQEDSTTGLKLDAYPDDPAAAIDTDGDGY
ncbi:MAG: NosD domain-containing protein, partial [Candidatus Thermoplasmatota archaeon]|nr:NosD domain-containing protein [Candidatus Thermoplasmatota archaeon]